MNYKISKVIYNLIKLDWVIPKNEKTKNHYKKYKVMTSHFIYFFKVLNIPLNYQLDCVSTVIRQLMTLVGYRLVITYDTDCWLVISPSQVDIHRDID